MRVFCLCLALLLAACASPDVAAVTPAPQAAPQEQKAASDVALTPARILGAMAEAYAGCTSYRDSGVSTTKITKGPIIQKPFKTAFVRPSRFRFECSQQLLFSKQLWVVWTNGTEVTGWSTVANWMRADSLELALATATGVSGGTAQVVPKLLLPAEVGGLPLTDMANVERLPDADVGPARCYCLRGRLGDFPMTIWIDQQTHLLLRTETRLTPADGLEGVEVTTYEPEIDIQIGDGELELIPPSK